jgi:predicted nucleic acid-binding protein
MVVFDTDLLVGLLRGNESAIDKIKTLEKRNVVMSTTSITSYELFKGAYISSNPSENMSQIIQLLNNMNILNFDLDASKINARIYSVLKKGGKLTNSMDQMIAAITISDNETLITKNIAHYKNIQNLRTENW